MQNKLTTPLSNVQQELLKLFAADVPDHHLEELKLEMSKFLLKKTREEADKAWEEKSLSDAKIKKKLGIN